MEDKDLDKIFQDAFIDAEKIPNPKNWEKIEASLETTPQGTPIRSIKKIGAIAASISLICLGGYYGSKIITSNNTDTLIKDEAINTFVESHQIDKVLSQENKSLIDNKNPRADIASSNKIHKISSIENRCLETKNEDKNLLQPTEIELLNENNIVLTSIEPNITKKENLVIIQVTEIDDIKPLIENEEEEAMLASTSMNIKENKNIVTTLLNKLSENLDPNKEQTVRFVADEEGSFAINIINTFAKNRNKKRK